MNPDIAEKNPSKNPEDPSLSSGNPGPTKKNAKLEDLYKSWEKAIRNLKANKTPDIPSPEPKKSDFPESWPELGFKTRQEVKVENAEKVTNIVKAFTRDPEEDSFQAFINDILGEIVESIIEHPDEFTEEEKDVIEKLHNIKDIYDRYDPSLDNMIDIIEEANEKMKEHATP